MGKYASRCPVAERGRRCTLRASKGSCPRHGDVSVHLLKFSETGETTDEYDFDPTLRETFSDEWMENLRRRLHHRDIEANAREALGHYRQVVERERPEWIRMPRSVVLLLMLDYCSIGTKPVEVPEDPTFMGVPVEIDAAW